MAKIGFFGLGNMGLPMARNLLQAGHEVCGYDLQKTQVDELTKNGGQAADSIWQASDKADILITMLQTGDQVKAVCFGDNGIFQYAKPKSLFIDCSSIDVQASQEIHQKARDAGLYAVDAPVSGGVLGAEAGGLTFMVGGDEVAFNLAKPVLEKMGKTIIATGSPGSGQAAKICNNMILGISMIAVSEAFILADSLGLSAKKLFEVVTHSSGQCWSMSNYVPVPGILDSVPANRNYEPGFSAKMMLKDLMLSQTSAKRLEISTPVAEKATELYDKFVQQHDNPIDFSAIIQFIATCKRAL